MLSPMQSALRLKFTVAAISREELGAELRFPFFQVVFSVGSAEESSVTILGFSVSAASYMGFIFTARILQDFFFFSNSIFI